MNQWLIRDSTVGKVRGVCGLSKENPDVKLNHQVIREKDGGVSITSPTSSVMSFKERFPLTHKMRSQENVIFVS